MNQGYRDDLAAAQARIAELETVLAGGRSPEVEVLEQQHAALVRSVPTQARVRLVGGLAVFVTLVTVASMVFLSSAYDLHPRFTVAMQMLVVGGMAYQAMSVWLTRAMGLRSVALSERLLEAERARAALESRVRVAGEARVASTEPALEEPEEEQALRTSPTRR